MSPDFTLNLSIDLQRIYDNVQRIRVQTGVPVIAVIKADAYGLGAARVVEAIGEIVDGFYCFSLAEAIAANTGSTGKSTITLLPHPNESPEDFLAHHARPAVWDVARAEALGAAHPVLAVDTGMQRFAASFEQLDAIIDAGGIDEAFTHATRPQQAVALRDRLRNRGLRLHAAATALLDHPETWLDAVRPGLALYENALRASIRIFEARRSTGPIGYRGHVSSTGHHGVILAGYSAGLKPGPCVVNGLARCIFECGMQTSFVELGPDDRAGDEVVLVSDQAPLATVAAAWGMSRQEVLLRLNTSTTAISRTVS